MRLKIEKMPLHRDKKHAWPQFWNSSICRAYSFFLSVGEHCNSLQKTQSLYSIINTRCQKIQSHCIWKLTVIAEVILCYCLLSLPCTFVPFSDLIHRSGTQRTKGNKAWVGYASSGNFRKNRTNIDKSRALSRADVRLSLGRNEISCRSESMFCNWPALSEELIF